MLNKYNYNVYIIYFLKNYLTSKIGVQAYILYLVNMNKSEVFYVLLSIYFNLYIFYNTHRIS